MSNELQHTESGSSPPETAPVAKGHGRQDLTPEQQRAVHRRRYPDGLVCDACGTLIGSQGYALRAYVCAECRMDAQEKARAFERMRGRPKALTEAQMREADAYCTWCRRWFSTKDGGGGLSCDPCCATRANGWALPHEIPAPTGPRARRSVLWVPGFRSHQEAILDDHEAPSVSPYPVPSLRAGSSRQITPRGAASRLLGRSGRMPARRKVSAASLAALKRINLAKRALAQAVQS